MFSVKPLVCQKMRSPFWSTMNSSSRWKEEDFVFFINFTTRVLLWVLDIWGQIQSRSPSPELSCFLSILLLYRLLLPRWTVWAALSDSLHRDRDSWLCEVAVGWVSGLWLRCCSRWVWDGCEIQRVGSITSAASCPLGAWGCHSCPLAPWEGTVSSSGSLTQRAALICILGVWARFKSTK